MTAALILMSGGIDSAAALAWTENRFEERFAVSFLYHLRPNRERLAVTRLLQYFPARLLEIPMPFLRESVDLPAPLSNVPEGYISNRNLIFYSLAGHLAEVHRCDVIVGGHNLGDQEDFPDAAASFFSRLEKLTNDALLTRKIRIELPLAEWTKQQVLERARDWNVPLQHTWSCYWDGAQPCGKCASCVERAEAFQGAGMIDPLAQI